MDVSTWTIPPFFEKLRAIGNLDLADYRRTFNLGIGMILVVGKRNLEKAQAALRKLGETPYRDRRCGAFERPGVVYVGQTGVGT